jgi:ElaB/YqjD/DUF883 family membrane-anchored ribosome-binding protein
VPLSSRAARNSPLRCSAWHSHQSTPRLLAQFLLGYYKRLSFRAEFRRILAQRRNRMTASAIEKSSADAEKSGAGNSEHPTTEKLASAAHQAVDIAAKNLEQAEKALREARVAAGQKVAEKAEQAQSLSQDALAAIKAYVNLYPLRSVSIALASGFLLSALLKK